MHQSEGVMLPVLCAYFIHISVEFFCLFLLGRKALKINAIKSRSFGISKFVNIGLWFLAYSVLIIQLSSNLFRYDPKVSLIRLEILCIIENVMLE